MAKASGDDVLRRNAQANINALQKQYEKVSNAAGLYERRDKMSVAGFRKVKTIEELTRGANTGTISLPDDYIHRSLDAMALNYDIESPDGQGYFHYVEGTKIQNQEVFAGCGTRTALHDGVAEGLTGEYGGDVTKWQHVKGDGMIDDDGEEVHAEICWFSKRA